MLRSWKLGTAFGIGIFVHWSFLLLLAFVLYLKLDGGLALALYAVAMVMAVFGCVVLHELGHALTARQYGIGTRNITLYPLGGVALLERMSEKPWEELWIALAGPAVNVVIAVLLLLGLELTGVTVTAERLQDVVTISPGLLSYPLWQQLMIGLLMTNGFLALFNLAPAFPMDGGRVLRALLSMGIGHLRATEIATFIGMILAGLFVYHGLWGDTKNPMLVLIGLFVFFMGQQELAVARHREAVRRQQEPVDVLPVRTFMDVSAVPAEPDFSGFTWDRRARVWIEWRHGRPVHACCVESE